MRPISWWLNFDPYPCGFWRSSSPTGAIWVPLARADRADCGPHGDPCAVLPAARLAMRGGVLGTSGDGVPQAMDTKLVPELTLLVV